MVDQCTCCNGCFSRRQLSSYPSFSFPKKLLVAISIVVIVAMCLMPTEAQPLEHKRRHRGSERVAHPAHTALDNKKRHLRQKANNMSRRLKPTQTVLFTNETRKVVMKLRNTKKLFNDNRLKLEFNDIKQYKNVMPCWLPTVNFVEIHFHDYKTNNSRKNGFTVIERKFAYMIPKFYKSLVEYEQIFTELLNVETNFDDDPHNTYKTKRRDVIQKTLYKLSDTIQQVTYSMQAVKLVVPPFTKKLDLSCLEKKVYYSLCIKNDYLALRGYGNLINNWFLEFKCPRGTNSNKKMCRDYENKLKRKIKSRKDKYYLPTIRHHH